jgi:hypothetical protein
VEAQEHRPELFWVDEEDILDIELIQPATLCPKSNCETSLGQQLKSHKLHLGLHLVLKTGAILGG